MPLASLKFFIICLLTGLSVLSSNASLTTENASAKACIWFLYPALLKISLYCFSVASPDKMFSNLLYSFTTFVLSASFIPREKADDLTSWLSPASIAFFMPEISDFRASFRFPIPRERYASSKYRVTDCPTLCFATFKN